MNILQVNDLCFRYYNTQILHKVNFGLAHGASVCILGEVGSGKSTFAKILMGLLPSRSGCIRLFDYTYHNRFPSSLKISALGLSYVFQNCALISNLSVFENIALPLKYHNKHDQKTISELVHETMEKMLISDFKSKYPFSLSLGVQKRVAIARVLVTKPKIIILDEPTTGLDLYTKDSLLALLFNLIQVGSTSLVMITHEPELASILNTKIQVMHNRTLTSAVNPADLKNMDIPFVKEILN